MFASFEDAGSVHADTTRRRRHAELPARGQGGVWEVRDCTKLRCHEGTRTCGPCVGMPGGSGGGSQSADASYAVRVFHAAPAVLALVGGVAGRTAVPSLSLRVVSGTTPGECLPVCLLPVLGLGSRWRVGVERRARCSPDGRSDGMVPGTDGTRRSLGPHAYPAMDDVPPWSTRES